MNANIEAIRNHPLVGRGSCSPIDECYTDEDLIRLGYTLEDCLAIQDVWDDRTADAINSAF